MVEHNNNNGNLFEKWLNETYDYDLPRRGEIRKGVLVELDEYGAIVDIGVKHDGIVPRDDIERLDEETIQRLKPGQEVTTRVMQSEDQEGSLMLSLYQVRAEEDWDKAQEMIANDEIWHGEVLKYNRGGLLVKFGHLEAFVPASQLYERGKWLSSPDKRQDKLEDYVGEEIPVKFIEVNREAYRLIMSEKLAREELQDQNLERLLDELSEGEVVKGFVRHLTGFGAFVDIGGADGMIHISELSWQPIKHPSEVVQVGDEIEVQVLELDHQRQRINLSLKRLQPNPWDTIEDVYDEGQLVTGTVTNIVEYGAFVALDAGVKGLIHVSELAEPEPNDPREFVQRGEQLVLKIIHINASRERIGLSLKQVSEEEREAWLAQDQEEEQDQNHEDEDNIEALAELEV